MNRSKITYYLVGALLILPIFILINSMQTAIMTGGRNLTLYLFFALPLAGIGVGLICAAVFKESDDDAGD